MNRRSLRALGVSTMASIAATGLLVSAPAQAATGPSGQWNFDVAPGTSVVRDLDADSQDLTLAGSWSSTGGTVTFQAASSYATSQPGVDFSPGAQDFAFGVTVKTSAVASKTSPNIMQAGRGDEPGQFKLEFLPANGGSANCALHGTGGKFALVSKVKNLANGAWHTIVCSRAGNTVSIIVDGVVTSAVQTPGTITITAGRPLLIGSKGANTTLDDQVIGSFDCAAMNTGAGAQAVVSSQLPC